MSTYIISAGMPRSGSTLLYNILREILVRSSYDNIYYGLASETMDATPYDLLLFKTHSITPFHQDNAKAIFYSYRDVRTALVSNQRAFGTKPIFELAKEWIDQYNIARKCAKLTIRYESMINTTTYFIDIIALALKVDIKPHEILNAVMKLKPPEKEDWSSNTLLHKDHFTHTKDGDWRDVLDMDLKKQINSEFGWWFRECGYPTE